MTPEAMARVLIRNAHTRLARPDAEFIAKATGLPQSAVVDIAEDVRPPDPGPAREPAAAPNPPAAQALPPGGPARCHITALSGETSAGTILIGCSCGELLRAGLGELPRHWRRHRAGLR